MIYASGVWGLGFAWCLGFGAYRAYRCVGSPTLQLVAATIEPSCKPCTSLYYLAPESRGFRVEGFGFRVQA